MFPDHSFDTPPRSKGQYHVKGLKAAVIFLSAHNFFRMRTERGLFLRNHGKRMVRRPCAFFKKLQKGREIDDFTAFSGGDEEDRTLDLTDANRTLSQLSYGPEQ